MLSPILIPAYNPSKSLCRSVQELIQRGFQTVVVVDDGSKSESLAIFEDIRRIPQCVVLRHATNLGKGAALKTGFNFILVSFPEAQAIITADADGQHCACDIFRVALASQQCPRNLILGVRKFGNKVPLRSRFGNQMTRIVMRLFTGLNLSDTQTGLRAWPRDLCTNSMKIPINGYDFEMESLIRAKSQFSRKLRFSEVPIQTIYEDGNKSSHFSPLVDSLRIYFVFIRYCSVSIAIVLIDYLLFACALFFLGSVGWSIVAGRCGAFAIGFLLNKTIVFHSHKNIWHSFFKFLATVIVFGFISFFSITYLNRHFGLNIVLSKAVVELLLFFVGFAVMNLFVFNNGEDDAQGS